MSSKWLHNTASPLTGPTTASVSGPTCGGQDWPFEVVSDNFKNTIAIVPQQEFKPTSAVEHARLISAAPDLLEFVQQIFNGIDTNMLTLDSPADETLANVLSRGRKALSKATGAV